MAFFLSLQLTPALLGSLLCLPQRTGRVNSLPVCPPHVPTAPRLYQCTWLLPFSPDWDLLEDKNCD